MSTHAKAAEKFIADKERTRWHDQALFFVREKRDKMAFGVPEWEKLREMASRIKQHTISHLAYYLEEFEKHAAENGIHVHWAKDAEEHNRIVYEIIKKHDGKNLIKSKSMLSEECGMTPFLAEQGIDVVESDLGERIMQLMGMPPSHIVLPAIHVKREEVGKVFEKYLHTEPGNSDPTYLTHAARANLREKFLHADIAMTGVNFAVASSGTFVVCTNEGNADMGTSFPKVHIAIMGMEKVIPDYDALAVYIRLLARSATGQPSTTYTSHYKKPVEGQEMHIVIVDNGRSDILGNPDHIGMLKCIRCGSCINTCPVYRRTGGYSYSYFIPGPIGINLGMLNSPQKYSGNVSACSLCYSCSNVCPAKIDLAEQIYKWRQEMDRLNLADPMKKFMVKRMKWIMNHPDLFYATIKAGRVAEHMPRFVLYNRLDPWGKGRELPRIAPETFHSIWKHNKIDHE
ncbi:lactate utilization protein B [Gabonibacter chumensis]|uniref:lactate utilization protein B n=1 Tax=Gabonibacter chumensis TaxID=2972474 RepID=UPI0025723147|nr:lactate utilization protein B [Gabonibacter chumensis]MCR9013303.1 lactate utilization protein [Gabonibacter chumensis]